MLTKGLAADWRRERLPVLAAAAPVAARFLSPAEKGELREAALEVAAHVDDATLKSGLDNFARTVER